MDIENAVCTEPGRLVNRVRRAAQMRSLIHSAITFVEHICEKDVQVAGCKQAP